ncbi:MAG: metal-sensitive transcriptional regulator [Candidatus Omnitrophica bacterium]|nr:metal-sensitive transcriptional regulator [Candidatus Omnitrophota bacterium]
MVSFRQVKKMTNAYPSQKDELERLRKIEGQVRGVQKMIQEGRYCVDVLQLLNSIQGAIEKVENNILRRHLEGCVSHAVRSGSTKERNEKFNEILDLISKFRK